MANPMIEDLRARILAQARALEESEHKEAIKPCRQTISDTDKAHKALLSTLRLLTGQEVIELLRRD